MNCTSLSHTLKFENHSEIPDMPGEGKVRPMNHRIRFIFPLENLTFSISIWAQ